MPVLPACLGICRVTTTRSRAFYSVYALPWNSPIYLKSVSFISWRIMPSIHFSSIGMLCIFLLSFPLHALIYSLISSKLCLHYGPGHMRLSICCSCAWWDPAKGQAWGPALVMSLSEILKPLCLISTAGEDCPGSCAHGEGIAFPESVSFGQILTVKVRFRTLACCQATFSHVFSDTWQSGCGSEMRTKAFWSLS